MKVFNMGSGGGGGNADISVVAQEVSNLAVDSQTNTTLLSWSAADKSAYSQHNCTVTYKVYDGTSLLGETTGLSYNISSLSPGEHSFKVVAYFSVVFSFTNTDISTGVVASLAKYTQLGTPSVSGAISSSALVLTIGSVSNADSYEVEVRNSNNEVVETESYPTAGAKTLLETYGFGNYSVKVVAKSENSYRTDSAEGTVVVQYSSVQLLTPSLAVTIAEGVATVNIGNVANADTYHLQVFSVGADDALTSILDTDYSTPGEKTLVPTFTAGDYRFVCYCTSNNADYTQSNTETVNKEYDPNATGEPIYGVSGLYASTPALTRTDDATALSFVKDTTTGAISSDFNTVFPWSEATLEEDVAGNKFVKMPSMWFRVTKDASNRITAIAVSKAQGDALADSTWHQVPSFYYGRYGASASGTGLASVSGATRLASQTRAQFRTKAQNTGAGYFQRDLYHGTVMMFLWWIEFATKDSASIMEGNTSGSAKSTGGTDSVTTPSGYNTNGGQMRWHYIEDFVGNMYEFEEGIVGNGTAGGAQYVSNSPSGFNDTGTGMETLAFNSPASGNGNCLAALGWDESNPFLCQPIEVVNNSSYNTYFCDYASTSNNVVSDRGAYWDSDAVSGVSCFNRYTVSIAGANIGGRLLYVPTT